jgi:hypothetical protein
MQADALAFPASVAAVKGVTAGDLDGTYFVDANYVLSGGAYSNYVITVTGTKTPVSGETLVMSNVVNVASFGGSLLD